MQIKKVYSAHCSLWFRPISESVSTLWMETDAIPSDIQEHLNYACMRNISTGIELSPACWSVGVVPLHENRLLRSANDAYRKERGGSGGAGSIVPTTPAAEEGRATDRKKQTIRTDVVAFIPSVKVSLFLSVRYGFDFKRKPAKFHSSMDSNSLRFCWKYSSLHDEFHLNANKIMEYILKNITWILIYKIYFKILFAKIHVVVSSLKLFFNHWI